MQQKPHRGCQRQRTNLLHGLKIGVSVSPSKSPKTTLYTLYKKQPAGTIKIGDTFVKTVKEPLFLAVTVVALDVGSYSSSSAL